MVLPEFLLTIQFCLLVIFSQCTYFPFHSRPGIIAGAVVGSIIGAAIIIIVIVICCKMKNAKPRKPFVIKPTQPKRNVAVYTCKSTSYSFL